MKSYRLPFLCLATWVLLLSINLHAQQASLYPKHWWTGMKTNKIQLMVHAENIGSYQLAKTAYPGITIGAIKKAESPNYYFVDLTIGAAAKPGNCVITFSGAGKKPYAVTFPIKARRPGRGKSFAQGVTSSDMVYLIMPDRFSNGDESNDVIKGYKDEISDRTNPSAHHGGDIQGVINHADYLKDLGVTSVWLCPVVENDMPWKQEAQGAISGYHGYWITNHYEIDKRYGTDETYKNLADALHARGMKLIQDAVYNHVGDEHFLYRDKPFADMFNNWQQYTGSNHREEAVYSDYVSAANKKVMLDGWFTPHLPDVNLRNPYMANFLIQNSIWCTEEFGVDAWRVDTYKYCDEAFMNRCNSALLNEYPTMTIFGEAWANTVTGSAYFVRNNMKTAFKHNLQGTTDFPLQSAMLTALNQPFGWMEGANKLYNTLSQDVLYEDPRRNCIFLDNHDVERFMTSIGNDARKFKMGISLLFTLRGIPQLYYGTEVMLSNDNVQGDGRKRNDFPGGFKGDAKNKFEAANRSEQENEGFNHIRALANFRKTSKALTVGKMTDYMPVNGLYVYFRKHGNETVMCVLNTAGESKNVKPATYAETASFTSGKDVTTGRVLSMKEEWTIPAATMLVLPLQ